MYRNWRSIDRNLGDAVCQLGEADNPGREVVQRRGTLFAAKVVSSAICETTIIIHTNDHSFLELDASHRLHAKGWHAKGWHSTGWHSTGCHGTGCYQALS